MKFNENIIYFNSIYIIQSLKGDERQTGKELYDDIISRRVSQSENMSATLLDINSKDELIFQLESIRNNISDFSFPFLHFETHGNKEGIELKNGDLASWESIIPIISEINKITHNNLYISIAACKASNIQFSLYIAEPCPFRGFIAPIENESPYNLLNSFSEFFSELLVSDDFDKAITALINVNTSSNFHYTNSETFFDIIKEDILELEKSSPKEFGNMVNKLTKSAWKGNLYARNGFSSKKELRKFVRKYVRENSSNSFDKLKKTFCHMNN